MKNLDLASGLAWTEGNPSTARISDNHALHSAVKTLFSAKSSSEKLWQLERGIT